MMHFEVSDLMVTVLPSPSAMPGQMACPTETTTPYEDDEDDSCPTETLPPNYDDDCPTETTKPDDDGCPTQTTGYSDDDGDDDDDKDDDYSDDGCPTVTLLQTSDCASEAKAMEAAPATDLEAHLHALRSRLESESAERTGATS